MRRFSKELYPTVRDETFFESCGVADLIATCYGGRNRLVAMEFTRQSLVSKLQVTALFLRSAGMYGGAAGRAGMPGEQAWCVRVCCCT
jgi:hypothetical protein